MKTTKYTSESDAALIYRSTFSNRSIVRQRRSIEIAAIKLFLFIATVMVYAHFTLNSTDRFEIIKTPLKPTKATTSSKTASLKMPPLQQGRPHKKSAMKSKASKHSSVKVAGRTNPKNRMIKINFENQSSESLVRSPASIR